MNRRLRQLRTFIRQYPFSGICTALSVFFLVGTLVLSLQVNSLSKSQIERQTEVDAVVANLISTTQLQQELAFARQTMERVEAALVNLQNLPENMIYFESLQDTTGATVEEVRPYSALPVGAAAGYKRVPFNLKVSGTFPQVLAFLRAVESGPRLAAITHFSFKKRAGGSVVSVDLSVDLLGRK